MKVETMASSAPNATPDMISRARLAQNNVPASAAKFAWDSFDERGAPEFISREGRRTSQGSCPGRAQPRRGMRPCSAACRTCCPTNDTSPCRNVLDNDRRLDDVSSCPRTTVQGDFVEVAAGRAEKRDRGFLLDDCFDGKSIRQGERVSTRQCCAANDLHWVEAHVRQVFQSVGGRHDALA
jgi:hypothetical protein